VNLWSYASYDLFIAMTTIAITFLIFYDLMVLFDVEVFLLLQLIATTITFLNFDDFIVLLVIMVFLLL